jgi:VWFA-related protein
VFVATAAVAGESITISSAPRTIDVVVSDARGNRIHGLAQSEFAVLEDGQPRSIARFVEVANESGAGDNAPPRSILLIFDETSISLAARRTTVDALKEFVQTRVRPIDRLMVTTIAGMGGVFPATGWTSDKTGILAALDKAQAASIGNKGVERREAERHIQLAIDYDRQAAASGQTMITFDTLMQSGRQYASGQQQEARSVAAALSDALGFLGAGPGKKVAIIAGGGLSTRPGSDIFEYLEALRQQATLGQVSPGASIGASTANPRAETSRYEISESVRQVAQMARDRGIVVYTIDPDTSGSGTLAVERTDTADMNEEFAGVADRMSGYQLLSSMSGGLMFMGRNNSITNIAQDLDSHYLISYTQTLTARGKLPKTDVRVKSYKTRAAFTGGPATPEAEIQDTVIANHISPPPSNEMHIALAQDPPTIDGDERRVKLRVLIPVKSLKLEHEGNEMTGGFAVYISTGDDKGHASAVNRQSHAVRWPADKMPEMMDKTIGFAVDVVMKAGRSQISVGVMDERSQQTGFAKTTM